MNYIFLDIDGVLNNRLYLLYNMDEDGLIDEKAVELLGKLVKQFDAIVILSSSWRNGFDNDMEPVCLTVKNFDGTERESKSAKLLKMLNKYGIILCGKTESIGDNGTYWARALEIHRYVKNHLNSDDKYVILDDEDVIGEGHPDLVGELAPHFVRTSFVKNGFDQRAYDKAAKILNK